MKKLLHSITTAGLLLFAVSGNAQCGAGYTQAQVNWDKLDYYWNTGGSAPYASYITDAQEMSQKFAIGKNYVTIALSANSMVSPGATNTAENTTHTGDVAGYTGADVQYNPSVGGQTITLTFNTEVYNLGFTLYDIDASQVIDLGAKDASNNAQSITVSTYGVTTLVLNPLSGVGNNPRITGGALNLGNTLNTGTATITVAGPVKTFTISFNAIGTDPVVWLSDINACVAGTFPTNYNQTPDNRPLQGPAGNQGDYFIVTPDNDSVFIVDAATGAASYLFKDASLTYVNSLAYDPYHHFVYYISEHAGTGPDPADPNNKALKKFDCTTGVNSTIVANITTTLGIPTFDGGIESAGAAFYDGALYLGIEGGRTGTGGTTVTRETMVWRIDFDASNNPTNAYQVWGVDAYKNASDSTTHDFGDFIIKNGMLYDYNTAKAGAPATYKKSTYEQFDMMTGQSTIYNNPGTAIYSGQACMDWSGNLYTFFANGFEKYNENGVNSTPMQTIKETNSTGYWKGGAGDAAENFRPQVDFGDAPSTYDPNPLSPAAHAQIATLRLGASQDKEWISKGQTALANSDNFDDGVPTVQIFNPLYGNYLAQVSVFNNTGSTVNLGGWIDYNGNGVFDASEGVVVTVPSSASTQSVYLYWPSTPSTLPMGSYTYLRIRVTSKAMTTANPTGYYNDGEVEDYRVPVNTFPLAVQQTDFNAQLTSNNSVALDWSSADETNIAYYSVEKSINGKDWELVHFEASKHSSGIARYETSDATPFDGTSYYRLRVTETNGKMFLSDTKKIEINTNKFSLMVAPNPATTRSYVYINSGSAVASTATLEVINAQGLIVHKEQVRVNPGTNSISLPINTKFTNGRYIVRLTTNDKTYTQSLIINK